MGDLGGLILLSNGAIPGIGEGVSLACAGVSRQDAKSLRLMARVGLPANHANVANPPCDKAIPPPRLHISVALLSTFDFLPTNPG